MGAKPKELRDYDKAILHALEDGLVHSREELMRVGCAAIDPHYALSMYQKKNGTKAEERFEGLDPEERLAEIAHQRYEGAKLQVGKRLSHMEDGGLIEVVEWGAPRPGRQRKQRLSYRITDRGRARFNGAPDEELDATWEDDAREVLLQLITTTDTITTEDVWSAGLRRPLARGHSPLAPVFIWAQRQGFIEQTGETKERQTKSGGALAIWRSLLGDQHEIEWLTCWVCGVEIDPVAVGSSMVVVCNQEVLEDRIAPPQAPEPTGDYFCPDCTKALMSGFRRQRKNIRQNLRDSRGNTRVSFEVDGDTPDLEPQHPDVLV